MNAKYALRFSMESCNDSLIETWSESYIVRVLLSVFWMWEYLKIYTKTKHVKIVGILWYNRMLLLHLQWLEEDEEEEEVEAVEVEEEEEETLAPTH